MFDSDIVNDCSCDAVVTGHTEIFRFVGFVLPYTVYVELLIILLKVRAFR